MSERRRIGVSFVVSTAVALASAGWLVIDAFTVNAIGPQLRRGLILVAVFAMIAAFYHEWRRLRDASDLADRQALGRCEDCGYDLRAGHDRCPECGWEVKDASWGRKL